LTASRAPKCVEGRKDQREIWNSGDERRRLISRRSIIGESAGCDFRDRETDQPGRNSGVKMH